MASANMTRKALKTGHQGRTDTAAFCACVQVTTVSVWEQERCTEKYKWESGKCCTSCISKAEGVKKDVTHVRPQIDRQKEQKGSNIRRFPQL